MASAVSFAALLLVLLDPAAGAQQNARNPLENVLPSIVRVECRTEGATRWATGFLWRDATTVVTALHAVAGCSAVFVRFEAPASTLPVQVAKVLRRADLALLRIQGVSGRSTLQARTDEPAPNEHLEAIGYLPGVSAIRNVGMRMRPNGGRKLRDIVPTAVAAELSSRGSPSLDLEICDIQGHLLPGQSGAPVTDTTGKLVAIGDGGLASGALELAWAIPVKYLADLLNSREDATSSHRELGSATLFAAETESRDMGEVECGGIKLTKVRSVPVRQLLASLDDPARFVKIYGSQIVETLNDFGLPPFEVLEHLPTGATIALPPGSRVRSTGSGCQVALGGGRIFLNVKVALEQSMAAAHLQPGLFEQSSVFPYPQEGWTPSPDGRSEASPRVRFDGLMLQRKALVYEGPPRPPLSPNALFYETLAIRNSVFLGVSTLVNIDFAAWSQEGDRLVACIDSCPQKCEGDCLKMWNILMDFIYAELCVDLATFAIG
jgi:hypothetical protein